MLNTGTVFGVTNVMMDVVSTEASSYVGEHYNELVLNAKKMGIDEHMCHDIVHDVYMSLKRSEENGDGYDICKGKKGECISLEQFVYGRLKGYSKNEKYHVMDGMGMEVSASPTTTELDDMNGYQKAYANAKSFDDIELLEEEVSIPEEINYLLSFEGKVNVRFIIKNIAKLARMDFDVSLLNDIKKMVSKEPDFAEALSSVVKYAGSFPSKYDELVRLV